MNGWLILITLFVGIATAITLFIASDEKIIDKEKRKITKKGWTFIVSLIILVLLPLLQNIIQRKLDQKNEDIRELAQKRYYHASVMEMQKEYENGSNNLISTISQTLGKYGYALDSTNKRLIRLIKDSSKTNITLPAEPYLSVFNLTSSNNNGIVFNGDFEANYDYTIYFSSREAESCDFNVKCDFVILDSTMGFLFINEIEYLKSFTRIGKDFSQHYGFSIPDFYKFNFVYVYVHGTYKNADKSKTFFIDDVYYYNKKNNDFGSYYGITRDAIINCINSYFKRHSH